MSEEVRKLTAKPFFDYTEAERQQLFKLVEMCVQKGTRVILGQTRCFFCGTELDKVVESKQVGMGTPLIITNLCQDCYMRPETQAYIKDGFK